MWITDAAENQHYDVRAESHGSVYKSRLSISGEGDSHALTIEFGAEAQTFVAKLLSATMGVLLKGATKNALLQDLEDIKAQVEGS